MYSPIRIRRILNMRRFVHSDSMHEDSFVHSIKKWFITTKPNPLGRWCHMESDLYKKTCKPHIKNSLANLDNSYQHNDSFDVISHLEMYSEFEDRERLDKHSYSNSPP
jgi:hypothetical protein